MCYYNTSNIMRMNTIRKLMRKCMEIFRTSLSHLQQMELRATECVVFASFSSSEYRLVCVLSTS